MFTQILCATDLSEPSRAAVRRAALLCRGGAALTLLHVFDPAGYEHVGPAAIGEERVAAQLLLDDLCGRLVSGGARATARLVDTRGHADETIVEEAAGADLVVVGSHGRTGVERLVVGSVAEVVVRSSPVPVLVARGEASGDFTRILCATDFSAHADRALDAAIAVAAPGATVDVLYVIQLALYVAEGGRRPLGPTQAAGIEADVRRRGEALVARHAASGRTVRFAHETGRARGVLLDRLAGGGHDLLAMGSHGRRGMRRLLLGSVAEDLVRHAPCSVLVCRGEVSER